MLFGYILGALIYMLLFSKYIKALFEMIFDLNKSDSAIIPSGSAMILWDE